MKLTGVCWLLALFAGLACLQVAGSLDGTLDGFRPLDSEATSVKVGQGLKVCDYECSDDTITCPDDEAKKHDRCPGQDKQKACEEKDPTAPRCFICEKAEKVKICNPKKDEDCIYFGAATTPCGKMKYIAGQGQCEWKMVGTKFRCRCKALPKDFSKDDCYLRDCKAG